MADQELEIEIDAAGRVTMRTKGIKGAACMDFADLMAQIVGREESRETTAEFYEEAGEEVRNQVDVKQRR